jgi:hypothetical protein
VLGADADLIRNGAMIATSYFAKVGAPATWRYDLVADSDLDALVAAWVKAGTSEAEARQTLSQAGAVASNDKVFILTSKWDTMPSLFRLVTAVHELWHTVQYALAGRFALSPADQVPPGGPVWLNEGCADFVAYSALADARVSNAADFRTEALRKLKNGTAGVDLPSVATRASSGQYEPFVKYTLGFFAVELLVRDKGMGAIAEYYRQVGQGKPWQQAFQDVFGRSVDTFYGEFATYRSSL